MDGERRFGIYLKNSQYRYKWYGSPDPMGSIEKGITHVIRSALIHGLRS